MHLRTMLTIAMACVASLALAAAGALVVLTTYLHRAVLVLESNAESVRLFQDSQVELLLHARATDPLTRADRELTLQRSLQQSQTYVTSDRERELLASVERRLDAYLRGGAAGVDLEGAFRGLDDLVDVNLGQAREVVARATRWDRLGNLLGTGVAAVLVLGVAGTIVWIRRSAFQPILSTAAAMQRFGSGAKDARAPERGAPELREMARRFNEMASSLAHQHERQMVFLAGVAHDLRNPLSALKMSTAVVAPDRPLPSEEHLRRALGIVGRQVDRLERMLSDFLDTARIEAGQLELRIVPSDAGELARGVVDFFRFTSETHELRLEAASEPLGFKCDPARVEQVLNNLVSNAIKYSPGGGDVRIHVRRERAHVLFSVSDQGIGIPLDEQAHLFEPFRRVRASASAIPGMGLGLYVSQRIAEAHGGRIEVTSAPGEGSTFTLRLPIEPHTSSG